MCNEEDPKTLDGQGWSRDKVPWPAEEPIPASIEEALAIGWELGGFFVEPCDENEFVSEGTADLRKTVGMIELYLKIPVRQVLTYGKPYAPDAIVETSSLARHKCQTLVGQ
jgi:hypothetical protein